MTFRKAARRPVRPCARSAGAPSFALGPGALPVSENIWNGRARILSRSGVHPTERALIESMPVALPTAPARLLVVGNRSGALAWAAGRAHPDAHIVAHVLDVHHAQTMRRYLEHNACTSHIEIACVPRIPSGPFDAAFFQLSKGSMPTELVLDLLEEIHEALADGGLCTLAADDAQPWLKEQMAHIFGACHSLPIHVGHKKKAPILLRSKRQRPLKRVRSFQAEFEMTLPGGGPVLKLVSIPGIFSHRRVDAGAQALAETAARELHPNERILDIGCGCGAVGFMLALCAPTTRVWMIDSHARAVWAAAHNARRNGLTSATVLLRSDGLPPETPSADFTMAVANPPYFSDFRIADLFIQTAFRALAPGGRLLLVTKHAQAIEPRIQRAFGHTDVISRRGYTIVRAVKKNP